MLIEIKVLTQYDYNCLLKAGMSTKQFPVDKKTTKIGTMLTFAVTKEIADKFNNM
jgi:hypothetical protein